MLSLGFNGLCEVVGSECIDQPADDFKVLLIDAKKQAGCTNWSRNDFNGWRLNLTNNPSRFWKQGILRRRREPPEVHTSSEARHMWVPVSDSR